MTINTTTVRILTSIGLVATQSTAVTVAILFQKWEPTPMQFKVLAGLAFVELTMMGFDVAQFAMKRFSDPAYAAAKHKPARTARLTTHEVQQ